MSWKYRPFLLIALTSGFLLARAWALEWSEDLLSGLLMVGLFLIGIPHGALDVWTHRKRHANKSSLLYVVKYLALIGLVLLFWMALPQLGLTVFLALSAWHFGQADMEYWELKHSPWWWGLTVLGVILVWHLGEVVPIIRAMGIPDETIAFLKNSHPALKGLTALGWLVCSVFAVRSRSNLWMGMLVWLVMTIWMPVLLAFGLYFIGQHSFAGWHHLVKRLGQSNWELWRLSVPFTAGAWLLIALGIWKMTSGTATEVHATVGAFFMLLGSISIPHIFESHSFLRNDD